MTDVTSERNRDSRVRCFACPDALTGLRVFRARAENQNEACDGRPRNRAIRSRATPPSQSGCPTYPMPIAAFREVQ